MTKKMVDPHDFLVEIVKYVDSLEAGKRKDFVCSIIFNCVTHAGENDIEMLGILECVKSDIIKICIHEEENDDEKYVGSR